MRNINPSWKLAAVVLVTGLFTTGPAWAMTTQDEAEAIAEKVLGVGVDLFNAKDAQALAATYTEDGQILLIGRQDDQLQEQTRRGRAEIEKFYRDVFENTGTIDARNTVEFARLVTPEILVIHGQFRYQADKGELPFVQLRIKQGDDWKLKTLWLFLFESA